MKTNVDFQNTYLIKTCGYLEQPEDDERSYVRFCSDHFISARAILENKLTHIEAKQAANNIYFLSALSMEAASPESDEDRFYYLETAKALIEDGNIEDGTALLDNLQAELQYIPD